jgi:hypothetical protein
MVGNHFPGFVADDEVVYLARQFSGASLAAWFSF